MVGAAWPGLAHTVDVMPTFLHAAGVAFDPVQDTYHGDDASIRASFDGLNLLPAIQANATSPRTEVVHMISNQWNHAVCDESTGVGGQNHCGAAITVGDFKLLLGYPGTDAWVRPPSVQEAAAVCEPASFLKDVCFKVYQGQLSNFSATTPGACCAACSANPACGSWSLKNPQDPEGSVCYLKKVMAVKKGNPGCTSGVVRNPGGGSQCNMTTGIGCPCNPPSKGCLFHLPSDPNEHHDLSDDPAHAQDFARLLARLEYHSKTGVVATEEMLGKQRGQMDAAAACALVNATGYYESFAPHVPFVNHPAPDSGTEPGQP